MEEGFGSANEVDDDGDCDVRRERPAREVIVIGMSLNSNFFLHNHHFISEIKFASQAICQTLLLKRRLARAVCMFDFLLDRYQCQVVRFIFISWTEANPEAH